MRRLFARKTFNTMVVTDYEFSRTNPVVDLRKALHRQLTTNMLHPHHRGIELLTKLAVILKVSRGRPTTHIKIMSYNKWETWKNWEERAGKWTKHRSEESIADVDQSFIDNYVDGGMEAWTI